MNLLGEGVRFRVVARGITFRVGNGVCFIMNLLCEGVRFWDDERGIRFRVDNGVFVA